MGMLPMHFHGLDVRATVFRGDYSSYWRWQRHFF
jgi:hypothetical protein